MMGNRRPRGLSSAEAAERLARFGPNALPEDGGRGFLALLGEILTEPMLLLLIAAAGLYLVLGDLAEGVMLAFFAALTIGLVVYQRRRSENALAALKQMAAPKARVLRDGERRVVPAAEIVPGDIILLEEGERVAADARLADVTQLYVDESLLTGESAPVTKRAATPDDSDAPTDPGGDAQPWVWSGTLTLRGHGAADVLSTGGNTRAGAIGASLAGIVQEKTRLERSVTRIVRIFGALGLAVSLALMAWIGLASGDWLRGALSAIALAMAMLPEEFPVVLTVFLALGAWRLAQIKVLARRPAVVEMLGAADTLCVDKTGTITENRMRVAALDTLEETRDLDNGPLPGPFTALAEAAWLATRRGGHDTMDRAVADLAGRAGSGGADPPGWTMAREYDLTRDLLATSYAWRRQEAGLLVASKGAPEAILGLCRAAPDLANRVHARVRALAEKGYRVLAVATAEPGGDDPPDDLRDLPFRFRGLAAFEDPVRANVPDAVAEARRAGMAVKIITGDYPETARAIAADAGVTSENGVVTGVELADLDDRALATRALQAAVFARVMPEQKLRLVESLKKSGRVVAMTGDGVNDAPALKAAHIGIAIGEGGTDVAREAAGIVLIDGDFGHLVNAVRMGRRIFDNLRKAMIYIAGIHVPIAGLALLPLLFGLPPLLYPAHVVLTEMVIDPMSSIAFESTPEEKGVMDRPPRPLSESIAGFAQIALGLAQGSALLAAAFAAYVLPLSWGYSADEARTAAFLALTAGNIGLVRLNDTRRLLALDLFTRGHIVFWGVATLAALVVAACIGEPHLRALFGFALLPARDILAAVLVGLLAVFIVDLTKLIPAVRRVMGEIQRAA